MIEIIQDIIQKFLVQIEHQHISNFSVNCFNPKRFEEVLSILKSFENIKKNTDLKTTQQYRQELNLVKQNGSNLNQISQLTRKIIAHQEQNRWYLEQSRALQKDEVWNKLLVAAKDNKSTALFIENERQKWQLQSNYGHYTCDDLGIAAKILQSLDDYIAGCQQECSNKQKNIPHEILTLFTLYIKALTDYVSEQKHGLIWGIILRLQTASSSVDLDSVDCLLILINKLSERKLLTPNLSNSVIQRKAREVLKVEVLCFFLSYLSKNINESQLQSVFELYWLQQRSEQRLSVNFSLSKDSREYYLLPDIITCSSPQGSVAKFCCKFFEAERIIKLQLALDKATTTFSNDSNNMIMKIQGLKAVFAEVRIAQQEQISSKITHKNIIAIIKQWHNALVIFQVNLMLGIIKIIDNHSISLLNTPNVLENVQWLEDQFKDKTLDSYWNNLQNSELQVATLQLNDLRKKLSIVINDVMQRIQLIKQEYDRNILQSFFRKLTDVKEVPLLVSTTRDTNRLLALSEDACNEVHSTLATLIKKLYSMLIGKHVLSKQEFDKVLSLLFKAAGYSPHEIDNITKQICRKYLILLLSRVDEWEKIQDIILTFDKVCFDNWNMMQLEMNKTALAFFDYLFMQSVPLYLNQAQNVKLLGVTWEISVKSVYEIISAIKRSNASQLQIISEKSLKYLERLDIENHQYDCIFLAIGGNTLKTLFVNRINKWLIEYRYHDILSNSFIKTCCVKYIDFKNVLNDLVAKFILLNKPPINQNIMSLIEYIGNDELKNIYYLQWDELILEKLECWVSAPLQYAEAIFKFIHEEAIVFPRTQCGESKLKQWITDDLFIKPWNNLFQRWLDIINQESASLYRVHWFKFLLRDPSVAEKISEYCEHDYNYPSEFYGLDNLQSILKLIVDFITKTENNLKEGYIKINEIGMQWVGDYLNPLTEISKLSPELVARFQRLIQTYTTLKYKSQQIKQMIFYIEQEDWLNAKSMLNVIENNLNQNILSNDISIENELSQYLMLVNTALIDATTNIRKNSISEFFCRYIQWSTQFSYPLIQASSIRLIIQKYLNLCASNGNAIFMFLLIRWGAGINLADERSYTALHHACYHGNPIIVEYLLLQGANTSIQSKDKSTVLHSAAVGGNADIIKKLAKYKIDVSAQNSQGFTALHLAAANGNLTAVHELISMGTPINILNNHKQTSLYKAIHSNKLEVVEYLLDNGSDLNCFDDQQSTPLHFAASMGRTSIIKLLLDRGANPEAKDSNDRTPDLLALHFNKVETAKFIQNYIYSLRHENGKKNDALQKTINDQRIIIQNLQATVSKLSDNQNNMDHPYPQSGLDKKPPIIATSVDANKNSNSTFHLKG